MAGRTSRAFGAWYLQQQRRARDDADATPEFAGQREDGGQEMREDGGFELREEHDLPA